MGRTIVVADQYCGGGGMTTGLRRAAAKRGIAVREVAINHSPEAIATHSRNHPDVAHILEDLEEVNPREALPEGRADVLCSSPSCTGYSTAKGGKPTSDQERSGPWQITRWCRDLDEVRTVFVENVPEIVRWGPLCKRPVDHDGPCRAADTLELWPGELVPGCRRDGQHEWRKKDRACRRCGAPRTCDKEIPERRGEYFRAWLREFADLGYRYEWRVVNAADHGAATSRRRFFLKARNDGLPIPWATPTHAPRRKAAALGLKPWRPARDVLDLDDRGDSVLDRPKPLSKNTLLRIARGLLEFCGPLGPLFVDLLGLEPRDLAKLPKHLLARPAGPFVVANRNNAVPRDLDEPLPTFTTAHGGGALVVQPFLLSQASGGAPRSTDDPLPTIPTGGAHGVAEPSLEPFTIGQRDSWDGHQLVPGRARGVGSDPLQTITTDPGIQLIQPEIEPFFLGQRDTSTPRSLDEPLPTIVTVPTGMRVIQPYLDVYYGHSQPDSIDEPLSTLTTKPRHGLVSPLVVPYGPTAEARSAEEPLPTILTKDRLAVAQPFLDPYYGPDPDGTPHKGRSVDEPMPTLRTEPTLGLAQPAIEPFLVPNFGERSDQAPRAHSTDDPLPAVTSRGAGNLIVPAADAIGAAPAPTDPRRIVLIDGKPFVLNLYYRMLRTPELSRGMGFPDGYWFAGSKRDATKQIGNAVEVNVAEAELGVILDSLFPAALEEAVA